MNFVRFVTPAAILVAACLSTFHPSLARAQDDGTMGPPKILVIVREFTKPGKGGALHTKTEAAYVQALAAGKAKPRYLAMTSLSGLSRAVFFSGYPSLTAWEEENKSVDKDAALSAALDRANVADGDLLAQTEQTVLSRRDDMSLNPGNLVGMRYMEVSQFFIKPGHVHEWDEAVKLVIAAYKKVPGANWSMFEQVYGTNSNQFLVLTPLKSMAEADKELLDNKKFVDAMGADGMKKLEALSAACIESQQSNLFAFSPKMSYPADTWIKAEPDYWKAPKVAAAAKPAPKSAP